MRIRDFSGTDFDPLSHILGATWHAEHGEQAHWQGADALCAFLAQSDHGFVAVDDTDALLGATLLASPRQEDHNDMLRMHWLQQRTRLAAMASALGIDARADASYIADEDRLLEQAAERLGTEGVGELVLFIVAPAHRGRGVGGRLFDKSMAWLAEHGASTVRLVTDDGCDWQYYEHAGFERVLEGVATEDPNCGMYVYQRLIDR